jgi:hypothetical protein
VPWKILLFEFLLLATARPALSQGQLVVSPSAITVMANVGADHAFGPTCPAGCLLSVVSTGNAISFSASASSNGDWLSILTNINVRLPNWRPCPKSSDFTGQRQHGRPDIQCPIINKLGRQLAFGQLRRWNDTSCDQRLCEPCEPAGRFLPGNDKRLRNQRRIRLDCGPCRPHRDCPTANNYVAC